MKIRMLLVDGENLLKRSFHGARDLETASYGHIGGLYSFMTTIRKLIKDHMINKTIICWDGEGGGILRHRIDRDYKANRETKEWYKKIELSAAEIHKEKAKKESLLKQRQRIKAYVEELFIRQIEVDDIEADDIIAQYCLDHNNKEEIFLLSNDRDFAQLLDLNITIIFPNIDQPVTKTNYMMYFDHHYSNALVMKIICGDASDNIKGVGGLKEKGLLKLFPELRYKTMTVREICRKADEINTERQANKKKPLKALENIVNNVPRLRTNFKLINLREPMLTEQAREDIQQLEVPLSPENRGSKNLYKMMIEDEFLTIYTGTFPQYVEPFYTVIMNEKRLLTEYYKKYKDNL
jgi:DNA polymerase I